jgi:hypothetical protein
MDTRVAAEEMASATLITARRMVRGRDCRWREGVPANAFRARVGALSWATQASTA